MDFLMISKGTLEMQMGNWIYELLSAYHNHKLEKKIEKNIDINHHKKKCNSSRKSKVIINNGRRRQWSKNGKNLKL